MPKLTDKERLDIQLGKHKRKPDNGGLPKAARVPANYGPSSSYTPASDYSTDSAGYAVPDRADSYDGGGGSFDGGGASGDY